MVTRIVKSKKRLVAVNPSVTRKPPVCTAHQADLVFDPAEGAWCCVASGCPTKKYPKAALENDGYPMVAKGALELVEYVDEDKVIHFLIRSTENNMVMDVTGLLRTSSYHSSPSSSGAVIELYFDRVAVIDGYGKKDYRGIGKTKQVSGNRTGPVKP